MLWRSLDWRQQVSRHAEQTPPSSRLDRIQASLLRQELLHAYSEDLPSPALSQPAWQYLQVEPPEPWLLSRSMIHRRSQTKSGSQSRRVEQLAGSTGHLDGSTNSTRGEST